MEENGQDGQKDDVPMGNGGSAVIGSTALRPVFLGNLSNNYTSEQVIEIFERPIQPANASFNAIPVDRVDLKRGYCFIFLKDAITQEDKEHAERFVSDINGMDVPNVSSALRAEFARGDGRIKRKEDDRRKRILPSETLFVVNFHEETTKRDDLRMLFEPYGELVRIEMKRNYAFVQFKNISEATRAKEEVNGGKLDQSVLTVEYVAQQRNEGGERRGGGGGGRDRRGGDRHGGDRRRDRRDRPYYDDHRRRSPPRRDDRYYDDRDRRRSPPRSHRGGGRSRSRSRSPPRYRSRSPRGGGGRDYYDDRGRHDDYRGDRGDRGYRGGGDRGGGGGGDRGPDRGGDRGGGGGGDRGPDRGGDRGSGGGDRGPDRGGDRGGGDRGPDRGGGGPDRAGGDRANGGGDRGVDRP